MSLLSCASAQYKPALAVLLEYVLRRPLWQRVFGGRGSLGNHNQHLPQPFHRLRTAQDSTSGDLLSGTSAAERLELSAQVFNLGVDIPQTIVNASHMLSKCNEKEGDLCSEPFPRQIRARKTLQAPSASYVRARWQAPAPPCEMCVGRRCQERVLKRLCVPARFCCSVVYKSPA